MADPKPASNGHANFLVFKRSDTADGIITSLRSSKTSSLSDEQKENLWRFNFGEEQSGQCFCCQQPLTKIAWKRGYIIPRSRNGSKNTFNIKPVCSGCHEKIGEMNMIDYMVRNNLSGLANIPTDDHYRQFFERLEELIDGGLGKMIKLVENGHLSETDHRIYRDLLKKKESTDERLALLVNIDQFYERCTG